MPANNGFMAIARIYLLVAVRHICYVVQSYNPYLEEGMKDYEIHQNAGRRQ
jgi:hypothetical protein